jgi:hypothetical protein
LAELKGLLAPYIPDCVSLKKQNLAGDF